MTELEVAYGLADRGHRVPVTPSTRLGLASGTKSLTAVVVAALVERQALGHR